MTTNFGSVIEDKDQMVLDRKWVNGYFVNALLSKCWYICFLYMFFAPYCLCCSLLLGLGEHLNEMLVKGDEHQRFSWYRNLILIWFTLIELIFEANILTVGLLQDYYRSTSRLSIKTWQRAREKFLLSWLQ